MAPRHRQSRGTGHQDDLDQRAATSRSIRDGIVAMATAMLLLLVFNSSGLQEWARNLPGNIMSDLIVSYTDRWHAFMQQIGTATPKDAVQTAVSEFRDYGWSDVAGFDATANAETVSQQAAD